MNIEHANDTYEHPYTTYYIYLDEQIEGEMVSVKEAEILTIPIVYETLSNVEIDYDKVLTIGKKEVSHSKEYFEDYVLTHGAHVGDIDDWLYMEGEYIDFYELLNPDGSDNLPF